MPDNYKITAIGALIGVFLMLAISRPALIEAILRGGVSLSSSVVTTRPLIEWRNWPSDNDTIIFVAAMLGFSGWYILIAAQAKLELLKSAKIGKLLSDYLKRGS